MNMLEGFRVASLIGLTMCLSCRQDGLQDETSAPLDPSLVGNIVINDDCAERVDEVTVVFQGKQHVVTNRDSIMTAHRLFKARLLEDTMEGWKTFRPPWGFFVERCTMQVHARGIEERRSTIAYIARRGTLLEMRRPIPDSPGTVLDYFRDDDQKLWRFLTSAPSATAVDTNAVSGGLSEGATTGPFLRCQALYTDAHLGLRAHHLLTSNLLVHGFVPIAPTSSSPGTVVCLRYRENHAILCSVGLEEARDKYYLRLILQGTAAGTNESRSWYEVRGLVLNSYSSVVDSVVIEVGDPRPKRQLR